MDSVDRLSDADEIVIATPTYMGNYNAMLKILFERFGLFEHMTSATFGNKYFVVVITASGEVANTIKALSIQVGIFGKGYVSGGWLLKIKRQKII